MSGPQTRSEVVELLERHELFPLKRWGQNFLTDANIVRRIVGLVSPGLRVVEVGVGTGTLTLGLAEAGFAVTGFEIDTRMSPLLEESLAGVAGIEIRYEDATKADWTDTLDSDRWALVSNLPYNIGTPLVLDLLRHQPAVEQFVVMVQLEVAERFTTGPGSKAYGLPSVVVALHGEAKIEFEVPPQVFIPRPEVTSAVVRISRKTPEPGTERAIALAGAGFGQRRKMLRVSLRRALEDPSSALSAAGIDPSKRAEGLSSADWLALAKVAP